MNFGVGDYILMNGEGYEATKIFVGVITSYSGNGCYVDAVDFFNGKMTHININHYFNDEMMHKYFGWVVTEQIAIPAMHSLLSNPVRWEDDDNEDN